MFTKVELKDNSEILIPCRIYDDIAKMASNKHMTVVEMLEDITSCEE